MPRIVPRPSIAPDTIEIQQYQDIGYIDTHRDFIIWTQIEYAERFYSELYQATYIATPTQTPGEYVLKRMKE